MSFKASKSPKTLFALSRPNLMIKIPATPAGLDAIEELVARGVTLNITLIFSERQYRAARDAAWRGAQRRGDLSNFKSVYSIFVSRVDVYTTKHSSDASVTVGPNGSSSLMTWQQKRSDTSSESRTLIDTIAVPMSCRV